MAEVQDAGSAPPSTTGPASGGIKDVGALLELMLRLGKAELASGEAVTQVELFMRRMARAYGVGDARIIVLPTAIFVTVEEGDEDRTVLSEGPRENLRLDQVADVYALADEAQRGTLEPADGLLRLTEILRRPSRFRPLVVVLGHAILTVGLALILLPTFTNLLAAAVLGALVGGVKMLNRDQPVLSIPMPVVAALMVSALVFLAVHYGLKVNPVQLLIPPLVTFLPGAMLTLAMVELAYGDMVSGTSRLITGFVQLVLLAFGIAAGAALVGVSSEALLATSVEVGIEPWAAWLGVLVFGVGVYLHFSAPRWSLLWMLLVLFLAFAAQKAGGLLFGTQISGFFGTLVATPIGYLIQLRFRGPPAMVTFLPSFWLVVPGSFGLVSVTRMFTDRAAGLDGMVTAVFVVASIALGCLVGASLYKWLTEYFGWWWLQIGRVGSYIGRIAQPKRARKDD